MTFPIPEGVTFLELHLIVQNYRNHRPRSEHDNAGLIPPQSPTVGMLTFPDTVVPTSEPRATAYTWTRQGEQIAL